MKALVEINGAPGKAPEKRWLVVGDSVVFHHVAQIELTDGRTFPAGPDRWFTVSVLAVEAEEVLDSEYVPPDPPPNEAKAEPTAEWWPPPLPMGIA